VAYEAVQGQRRGRHWTGGELLRIEPLALELQGRPVELQPRLEHRALREAVRRLAAARVDQLPDHLPSSWSRRTISSVVRR
jgi:hypothetical protein